MVIPKRTSRIPSSAATTNATSVKTVGGMVFTLIARNTTAADKFLKLYNKASAPTVGTDTPVLTLTIPAQGGLVIDFPEGFSCPVGIGLALTGAAADNDTTALALGDVTGVNVVFS